jgi:hypothetical protein
MGNGHIVLFFYPNKYFSTTERGLHMPVPLYTRYLELSADNYKIHSQTKQSAEYELLLFFIY